VNTCKIKVPEKLAERLEIDKADDEKVKELGIIHCTDVCKKLISKRVLGLHFYTMNNERSVGEVIKNLSMNLKQKERYISKEQYFNPKNKQKMILNFLFKYKSVFFRNKSLSNLKIIGIWIQIISGAKCVNLFLKN